MRFCLEACLILLLLGASALPAERPTVTLNLGALTVDETAPAITYADFISIPVSRTLRLPAKGFMVELYPGETAIALRATSEDANDVSSFEARIMDADIPTSADDSFSNLVVEHFSEKTSSNGPVRLLGETLIDNRRYAEFLLFPVTLDSLGKTTFWELTFLYIGSRLIAPDELFPRSEVVAKDSRVRLGSALGDPEVVDYVIVTSAELADAFDLLVQYKTETGVRTQIKLVEEIISEYSGRDDAEKLREYLKTFHAQGGRYVLLGGDDTVVPIRYAYYANTNSKPSLEFLQVCDLYFADLNGNWDADLDGVWGEPFDDLPDLTPELLVGRLPFTDAEEVQRYTSKLIIYEMTPGDNDREYLSRAFFFSSDQMRDFGETGQHGLIASAYPEWFSIDTTTGVEAITGDDISPSNTPPVSLGEAMIDGYGIINVIAHGRRDGFTVKSSGYNEWPKEFLLTSEQSGAHSSFDSLSLPDKPAFYYSLACETGRYDSDGQPGEDAACMARHLLGQEGGAVGFVAYSRWGWVNSSYLLQRSFFDSLFAYPERPAVEAMYASKNEYYFIRDNVYGQNYLGDPTLRVYVDTPASPILELRALTEGVEVSVLANGLPVSECLVVISHQGAIVYRGLTDPDGALVVDYPLDAGTLYKFTAAKAGLTVSQVRYLGSIATGVEDDDLLLPESFSLEQNYPNPFNPRTTIAFEIPRTTSVTLSVFNTLGRHVATLLDQTIAVGHHTVEWNAVDSRGEMVASGVYFYRLETESSTDVRKMILLR